MGGVSGSAEAARSTTDDDGEIAASGGPLVGGAVGSDVGPGRATGDGGVSACAEDNQSLLCALLKGLPQTVCMRQHPGMTGLCKDDSLAVNELPCFD